MNADSNLTAILSFLNWRHTHVIIEPLLLPGDIGAARKKKLTAMCNLRSEVITSLFIILNYGRIQKSCLTVSEINHLLSHITDGARTVSSPPLIMARVSRKQLADIFFPVFFFFRRRGFLFFCGFLFISVVRTAVYSGWIFFQVPNKE